MEALICIVVFFFWGGGGVFKEHFVNESSLVIKSMDILDKRH